MSQEISTNELKWHSGDWRKVPMKQEPYNGLEITGVPTYDDEHKFVSATITVKDFTKAPKGLASTMEDVTLADEWVNIPVPVTSPPSDDFTVDGAIKLRVGSNEILLRVKLAYGPEKMQRQEIGFIGGFPSVSPA
ncbi:hypothetical protein [Desulfobacter vibrioformis]|uniref:hypothetical protein n=1 Tax=Desulfobacter vibrioformis TaxID=34031 RepID=UPI00054F65BC|nr:hypothetical protein [Desulfobacter vibrioformis]